MLCSNALSIIDYIYKKPYLRERERESLLDLLRASVSEDIRGIESENCFYIRSVEPLTEDEYNRLKWLISDGFEKDSISRSSFFEKKSDAEDPSFIIETGPRLNFTTAWSTNAVSICFSCGLKKVNRIERSRRFRFFTGTKAGESVGHKLTPLILPHINDRMVDCLYPERLESFDTGIVPDQVYSIPLIERGRDALIELNRSLGLGLDERDIEYYYDLFVNIIGRNPTNVECFDLGQSNSEHSRHWFFKGRLIVNGKESDENLMDILSLPLNKNPENSLIAFKDNSSAIAGFDIETMVPGRPGEPSAMDLTKRNYALIFTAETHNFPTGVAPFPGAETGTGGRIRDVHATGTGSLVVAGTAAYCVGNLNIPGYDLPWENKSFIYPSNLATPLHIEIQASNGASDYGNKFGEPLIQGYTRSFGLRTADNERVEWIKPIMFTGGVGQIDFDHIEKHEPDRGMLVIKIGGPAYRIGIGGGAASSMIQGENVEELDFSAVQRGDAEMEQKVNRVIRACVEMGKANPIVSIHDQGAGGNSNVVKEIIYPAGADIEIRDLLLGDTTLSVLEIWGAEYQENDALLIKPEHLDLFKQLCKREKTPFSVIGEITGSGYIVLHDSVNQDTPVNLDLSKVLGKMPQKTYHLDSEPQKHLPLKLPEGLTVREALDRVLRLLSVGSKRFLTNKVDRSVTGLIVKQQCTGPLQLTISDTAVIAQSHFSLTGAAISIGEQPVKGLLDTGAMARMSLGEALTNMVWAKVTSLRDIKCSGNWMWAPKLPGEGLLLYNAAVALKNILIELGIAIDGGKDSLSMAALVQGKESSKEIVKSPGTLVISAYVTCDDITKVVSQDIKRPGESKLLYIDLGRGKYRTGGSALAHVYEQTGDTSPDVDDSLLLKNSFNAIQELIGRGVILSGHDRSDGGLITALLEMAFAGNGGLNIELNIDNNDPLAILFSEELGFVIEYLDKDRELIGDILDRYNVPFLTIGETLKEKRIKISHNKKIVLDESMTLLRDLWEETSYQIERLQVTPQCADEEKRNIFDRPGPDYKLSFTPRETSAEILNKTGKPAVAVIREEGSNGDREMASAFFHAGFEVWDITMSDLIECKVSLNRFNGIAFVGGFSYADVLGSAKGWAGVIRYNERIYREFESFYNRTDTFSLGVCNGCQLMALLGWVPFKESDEKRQPRFIHNISSRFESRFSTVKILSSPSIMLAGMEDSVLGVWVAHGEGRLLFPDNTILKEAIYKNLAPVRYVDDYGEITETYPFNPNGSPYGITALCSEDGRHLAMMPHPERVFLKWQWPWMPEEWKKDLDASPWLRMFQNAREWCERQ